MSILESGRDDANPESAAADGVSADQTAEPQEAGEVDVRSSGVQEEEKDGGVETPEVVVDAPAEPAQQAVEVSAEAAVPAAAPAASPAKSQEGHRWYIVHTYSGFENKVKETLQQRVDAMGMSKDIGEILIPSEDVVEVREGRKRKSTRKFFPGYLLVKMNMSDAAWHVVKDTPKVTGFVGTGALPVPLQDAEVERIVKQIVIAAEKPKPKLEYSVGESVRIVDGPFSNFTGQVEEVNQDRLTLKVMVTIFGRATPVELEFLQVQKP